MKTVHAPFCMGAGRGGKSWIDPHGDVLCPYIGGKPAALALGPCALKLM